MDVRLLWSLAETGYSLAAIAAMAVAWSIWQRAEPGRETTLLCGSVLALVPFYGCHAADAALQASGALEIPFTIWRAFGQTALVTSGALFVAFLLTIVRRLYAPVRPSPWLVGTIATTIGIAAALAWWLAGRLTWALVSGAEPSVLDVEIRDIVGHGGRLATVLCFAAPFAFLGSLFANVPAHSHARWLRWLKEGDTWTAVAPDTDRSDPRASSRATRTFRQLSLLFLWMGGFALSGQWASDLQATTPAALGVATVLRLLLFPSLLALVYYHARWVFFDVLVKRGVVAGLVAVSVTAAAYVLAAPMLVPDAGPWLAMGPVAATLLLLGSAGAIHRGSQWLDHLLFRRPDYRSEFLAITAAMAATPTVEALTAVVANRLRDTLRATWVRYDTERGVHGAVVVGLGRLDRPRGYLQLGPRARGQQYGSEDLTFIDAVAAQMASLLEGFDARESTRLATVAELKALRAQINPHFLFNALTTLAEMARGQPATERTILNLARVFRYALDATQHDIVPLRDEIDAVRAYLEIEAERFEEQLRFEIAVPEDVYDTPIPPMLLQPLVENAVKHGVSPRVSGGIVRVAAVRDGGHLRLTVQDDGVGFDLDRTPRRIGLANVGARVERTGGWWRVQSIPGAGTQVTLALVTP